MKKSTQEEAQTPLDERGDESFSVTPHEELISAITLADSGDPELNRYLLDLLLFEIDRDELRPELAKWFAKRLKPVLSGDVRFEVAFYLGKNRGGQVGTGTDKVSVQIVVLGDAILKIIQPELKKGKVNEKLGNALNVSPDRIRKVLANKGGIQFAANTLDDLSSIEGFDFWMEPGRLV